jgi:hypothetical protein
MFENSTVVLSPGRTGSVLLSQNLSRVHYSVGEGLYFHTNDRSLERLRQQRLLAHSHNLFSAAELQGIQTIFSVRRNLPDMLISHYIALSNDYWHLPQGQEKPKFANLTVDFRRLQTLIDHHQRWHEFYQSHLDFNSVVVIYEIMVDHLIQSSTGYQPLYTDKQATIANWLATIDYLDHNVPDSLREAHGKFIDYEIQPSRGIYRSAAGLA